jgi:glutaredoxin
METEIKELSLASLKGCPHCATAKLALAKGKVRYKEILWDEPEGEKIIEGELVKSN